MKKSVLVKTIGGDDLTSENYHKPAINGVIERSNGYAQDSQPMHSPAVSLVDSETFPVKHRRCFSTSMTAYKFRNLFWIRCITRKKFDSSIAHLEIMQKFASPCNSTFQDSQDFTRLNCKPSEGSRLDVKCQWCSFVQTLQCTKQCSIQCR